MRQEKTCQDMELGGGAGRLRVSGKRLHTRTHSPTPALSSEGLHPRIGGSTWLHGTGQAAHLSVSFPQPLSWLSHCLFHTQNIPEECAQAL